MVKKRKVTTSEIAKLSGVSRSTVSAVLRGQRKVRATTRQKVLDAIRKGNYESGMIARTLVGELSRMVAVLAPNIGSHYHLMVFRGLSEVLVDNGYHILFHNVRPEYLDDPETLESLHAYRPAGYIILRGAEGPHGEHAQAVRAENLPLVTMGLLEHMETDSVAFDERAAMRLMADHIIAQGHRKFGYLAGPSFSIGAKRRQMGFVESLIDHDLPVSHAQIVSCEETANGGYAAALEMLRDPATRPTAILCFNDMVAIGVYRAALELGLRIPHDISVAGFDGLDIGAYLGPPLTSVDLSPQQAGQMAAQLLLRIIRNETGRSTTVEMIEPKLLARDSVLSRNGSAATGASIDPASADPAKPAGVTA